MKKAIALLTSIIILCALLPDTVFAKTGDLLITLHYDWSGGFHAIPDSGVLIFKDNGTGRFVFETSGKTNTAGGVLFENLDDTRDHKIVVLSGKDFEETKTLVTAAELTAGAVIGFDLPKVAVSVPPPGGTVILPPEAPIPSYGWVAATLDQVKNPAHDDNAYEVTLNYRGYDSGAPLNNVEITVELPPHARALLYSDSAFLVSDNTITISIASLPADTNFREVFTIEVNDDVDFSMVAKTRIDSSFEHFTDFLGPEPTKTPLQDGHDNPVTDSYIETTEGNEIHKSPKRDVPSYTAFVDVDRKAAEFKIYTKISNTSADDNVIFSIGGQTFGAAYDPLTEYWCGVISGFEGYGNNDVIVSTNGNEALAGRLLILFGL